MNRNNFRGVLIASNVRSDKYSSARQIFTTIMSNDMSCKPQKYVEGFVSTKLIYGFSDISVFTADAKFLVKSIT